MLIFEFIGIERAEKPPINPAQEVAEEYEPLNELNTYGDGGADRYVHV
jgi:hypothetical protein